MSLHLQLAEPALEPLVQSVEVTLNLGYQPVETWNVLPLDLPVQVFGHLKILSVDQSLKRDFDVPADRAVLLLSLRGDLNQERLQGLLEQDSLDTAATGHDGEFTLEEYDAIRRHFKASGIPSGPTIDLSSPDLEEDENVPHA